MGRKEALYNFLWREPNFHVQLLMLASELESREGGGMDVFSVGIKKRRGFSASRPPSAKCCVRPTEDDIG